MSCAVLLWRAQCERTDQEQTPPERARHVSRKHKRVRPESLAARARPRACSHTCPDTEHMRSRCMRAVVAYAHSLHVRIRCSRTAQRMHGKERACTRHQTPSTACRARVRAGACVCGEGWLCPGDYKIHTRYIQDTHKIHLLSLASAPRISGPLSLLPAFLVLWFPAGSLGMSAASMILASYAKLGP